MSEKLCTLRTKGGGGAKYTETVLWTNPSPNSTFAAQNVTLSDSIDNYKYIAIKYTYNTQLQTGLYISTMIAAVDDVKKWGYNTGAHHVIGSTAMQNNQNNLFSRGCFYISSTSIRFSAGTQVGATTSNNDTLIPLEILGLNELDHGGMISDLLTPVVVTNNTSASSWYVNTTGIPKYAIVSSTRRDNGKNTVFMLDFENEMAFGYDASNGSYSQLTVSFSQLVSNITSAGFTVITTSGTSCHNMVFLYY